MFFVDRLIDRSDRSVSSVQSSSLSQFSALMCDTSFHPACALFHFCSVALLCHQHGLRSARSKKNRRIKSARAALFTQANETMSYRRRKKEWKRANRRKKTNRKWLIALSHWHSVLCFAFYFNYSSSSTRIEHTDRARVHTIFCLVKEWGIYLFYYCFLLPHTQKFISLNIHDVDRRWSFASALCVAFVRNKKKKWNKIKTSSWPSPASLLTTMMMPVCQCQCQCVLHNLFDFYLFFVATLQLYNSFCWNVQFLHTLVHSYTRTEHSKIYINCVLNAITTTREMKSNAVNGKWIHNWTIEMMKIKLICGRKWFCHFLIECPVRFVHSFFTCVTHVELNWWESAVDATASAASPSE